MSSFNASIVFKFFWFSTLHLRKLSFNFLCTLSMCSPEAQIVMAGKGKSVTGLAVSFRVVTTYEMMKN